MHLVWEMWQCELDLVALSALTCNEYRYGIAVTELTHVMNTIIYVVWCVCGRAWEDV